MKKLSSGKFMLSDCSSIGELSALCSIIYFAVVSGSKLDSVRYFLSLKGLSIMPQKTSGASPVFTKAARASRTTLRILLKIIGKSEKAFLFGCRLLGTMQLKDTTVQLDGRLKGLSTGLSPGIGCRCSPVIVQGDAVGNFTLTYNTFIFSATVKESEQ